MPWACQTYLCKLGDILWITVFSAPSVGVILEVHSINSHLYGANRVAFVEDFICCSFQMTGIIVGKRSRFLHWLQIVQEKIRQDPGHLFFSLSNEQLIDSNDCPARSSDNKNSCKCKNWWYSGTVMVFLHLGLICMSEWELLIVWNRCTILSPPEA